VIRLVRSIANPLNLVTATWTRFAVLAVCRHIWTKRRHLFRKAIVRIRTQTLNPVRQRSLDRRKELFDLFVCEFLRESERREFRFEENLVLISIASAAENSCIGEGAF